MLSRCMYRSSYLSSDLNGIQKLLKQANGGLLGPIPIFYNSTECKSLISTTSFTMEAIAITACSCVPNSNKEVYQNSFKKHNRFIDEADTSVVRKTWLSVAIQSITSYSALSLSFTPILITSEAPV